MRRPLPSEILEFKPDFLAAKGQAEAVRSGGSLVRAFCVAPGETARCLVGGKKKGARESWLQEIIVASPDRRDPRCPHFGLCGGCALQHLDYPAQVRAKAQPLVNRLREVAGDDFTLLPPLAAPTPWFYRGKVELSFNKDKLGFNRRGCFNHVVDVRNCFIAPAINGAILDHVRAWRRRHNLAGYDPREGTGFLRYLVLRRSHATDQFLVTLVTTTPSDYAPLQELADECMELGASGFIHVIHNSPSAAVMVESSQILAGQDCITERLGALEFDLNWRSFFQSNPPAFAGMLEEIKGWIPRDSRLLDLYCGVGTIGLSLLNSLGGTLAGAESVPEAIEDAKRNATRAGLQANFTCQNAEDYPDLTCDTLVLDPPRGGCHPKLIRRLPEEGPQQIVYVSCNPSRFIEEYAGLQERYAITRVRMFDFFPQTPHIETVAELHRR